MLLQKRFNALSLDKPFVLQIHVTEQGLWIYSIPVDLFLYSENVVVHFSCQMKDFKDQFLRFSFERILNKIKSTGTLCSGRLSNKSLSCFERGLKKTQNYWKRSFSLSLAWKLTKWLYCTLVSPEKSDSDLELTYPLLS